MKNYLYSAVLAVAVVGAIAPAKAQWVVSDPLHTYQTILSEVKRGYDAAADYATQAQQLQSQIRQYENMLKNSASLTDSQWSSVNSDVSKLVDLYRDSRSLASNLGDLDKRFGQNYGGYEAYANQFGKGPSTVEKYEQWSNQGHDNAFYSMKVAGMQVSMFESEDAVLNNLIQKSQSAEGRMQALQVANAMAAQQVQQSQKLRQLIASQMQMQANALALQSDREATVDANTTRFQQAPVKITPSKEF